MEKYKETIQTWNKVAQLYEDKFMELDIYNDTYAFFCEAIQKESPYLLEIGCGPGNITKFVANKLPKAKFTAIDVAENMIQLAKKNIPDVDFQVMDARHINQLKTKFDGIICGFIIPYLSKEDCTKFIQDSIELLNENGILYLSFVSGNYYESGFISGSSGDRTYFYYHELDELRLGLEQLSCSVESVIEKDYKKSDESHEKHTVVVAKKII